MKKTWFALFIFGLCVLLIAFLYGCGNATGGGGGGGGGGGAATYTLTLSASTEIGIPTSETCGYIEVSPSTEGYVYTSGTDVVLMAWSNSNHYMFSSWEGSVSGETSMGLVKVDGDKNILARFRIKPSAIYALHITTTPDASGSVVSALDGSTLSATYEAGAVVAISAEANLGYVFDHWGGDLPTALTWIDGPLTMNGTKEITAVFQHLYTYTLSVAVSPDASYGTATPSSGAYANGTVVSLTATPASGKEFVKWSGSITSTTNPYSLTMDGDKNITAEFQTSGGGGGSSYTPPIIVTTKSLPAATAGTYYNYTMGAYGGGSYSWDGATIAQASNNGMSIGTSSGVLSGTPSFTGTQPLYLTVQGANGSVGIEYDLRINGIGSSNNFTNSPSSATQNSPYTFQLNTTWYPGAPVGVWVAPTQVFGYWPYGLSIGGLTGIISGTPSNGGTYTFTLFAKWVGYAAPTNFGTFTMTVNPASSPSEPPCWARQSADAVLSPSTSGWDGFLIGAPSVIKIGSTYYLYYEGMSDSTYCRAIGLATSTDGLNWTKSGSNPVLSAGAAGEWDEGGVRYPTVYYDGVKYCMLYQGTGYTGDWIGRATSTDGIHWTKYASNPVITLYGITSYYCPGSVIKSGSQFVLFYSVDGSIGRITSTNGINWTDDTNPVLSPDGGSDVRYSRPTVVYDSGATPQYRMWNTKVVAIGGGAGNPNCAYPFEIGYAESPDGIAWTKLGSVFTAGQEDAWDRPCVGLPTVIPDGDNFDMWYVGGRGNIPGGYYDKNVFVEGSIGYAKSQ